MAHPDITSALVSALPEDSTRIVFLTGSGISYEAGYPTWDDLVIRLLLECGTFEDESTARLYLSAVRNRQVVADGARATCNLAAEETGVDPKLFWRQAVTHALRPSGLPAGMRTEVPAIHRVIARHAERFGTPVLTTNFDFLHEDAALAVAEDPDAEIAFRDRYLAGEFATVDGVLRFVERRPIVMHLHGHADDLGEEAGEVPFTSDADRLILTQTDYNRAISQEHPWQRELIEAIIAAGSSLVIIGHSLADQDLQTWLHHARSDPAQPPIGMMLIAREGLGPVGELSLTEFAPFQRAIRLQWAELGLRTVFIEHFSDAALLLEERFHQLTHSGYRAPKTRIRAFFEDVTRDNAIPAVSRDLADAIANAPAPPVHSRIKESNVTVWLADGEGYLHRVARDDRALLRLPRDRAVETRPGSHWIAAEALHTETVRVETSRQITGRWTAILGHRILLDLPGGPPSVCGALTVGIRLSDDGDDRDLDSDALRQLMDEIGLRSYTEHLTSAVTTVLAKRVHRP